MPRPLLIESREHIPLIAAGCTESLKRVQVLYDQVGRSERLSRQMLSIAVLRNHKDLAAYFLKQGFRLDSHDCYNIHDCIVLGKSFTTCKLLVAEGLDINYQPEWMGDILSHAAEYNNLPWVRFCLVNGADPNRNLLWDTYSPLAIAAQYASVKLAALLLKYNARIEGSGALALASRYGKMEMVKFLLMKGALIDEDCVTSVVDTPKQDAGGTALHLVKRGRVDILKYLLGNGARTTLMDHMGRTPLEKFLEIKDMKLVQALKDYSEG